MRGPTGVKFCTMVSTRPNFIMLIQNFGGGAPQKNFTGQKHAKLSPISDDYPKSIMRVRRMPMHLSSGHVTLMPRKNLNLNGVNENDPLGVEQKKNL